MARGERTENHPGRSGSREAYLGALGRSMTTRQNSMPAFDPDKMDPHSSGQVWAASSMHWSNAALRADDYDKPVEHPPVSNPRLAAAYRSFGPEAQRPASRPIFSSSRK